jgi:eukaryotic-like serine/threonine-protein kinase
VMVSKQGRLKVLDFGLARPDPGESGEQELTLTVSHHRVEGTLPYMAPEQVRGERADARTDIFALGVILYEMVTGKRPFHGASNADLSSAILRDEPAPVESSRPDLPRGLSELVSRCLEKRPDHRFASAQDVTRELRRVSTLRAPPSPPASTTRVASIGVLPFANRSRNEADEYFSDGLADELLHALARIPGLRVAARTSSFQFRSEGQDPGAIGRRLNVATLLEGSVRTAGPRVRISVALVNTADGCRLWSGAYDRTLEDIFAVQDDIAQSVVRELRTGVLGPTPGVASPETEVAEAFRGRGNNPEAHRLYLRARHLVERFRDKDLHRAVDYLSESVRIDPSFALAWTELGRAFTTGEANGWIPQGYSRGREAAMRALSIQPDLAEAHALVGWIQLIHEWDWEGADRSIRRALAMEPGNTMVIRRAAVLAWTQDRVEEAIQLNRRVVEQDPLNALAYGNLGLACHAGGLLEEAEEAFRRALEIGHTSDNHGFLALVLMDRGRAEEALQEALAEPVEKRRLWALALIHLAAGRASDSDQALERLSERHAGVYPFEIAEVHGLAGRSDEAFEWLERARASRTPMICDVKVSRRLRSLHGDPRWAALLERMRRRPGPEGP